MNQQYVRSLFRGGGLICSSQIPQEIINQDESIIDYDLIRQFFIDLDLLCSMINDLSKSIQSQESQVGILKTIKQIQYQSQFINQASRNNAKIKEFVKQIFCNLETLLDCITNTIISQRFITLQILIICNQISRLIFQYYAYNQSIPLDQERQQSILAIINQIEELLQQGGEQLYYNGIHYELFIIKICVEICPNNSEEGKEVLLSIISGISASLEELSTDLLTSLAQGGLYLYKEIKKRKQRNIFRIIFYLEEFKFRVIEKIQQGQGINNIIKHLATNYNILIKDSNEWLIKCSWIKIISDLVIYKPIITMKQFSIIKNKHQLQVEWQNLIQQRMVKIVDNKNNIAIILKNDDNSNANRILQQQIIKFQIIQNYIINGEKNLPKLEALKGFSNQIQDSNNQQSSEFIEQIQNTPITQFIQQLNEYSEQILKYVELVQDFTEEIEMKNSNQQYLLQQIEQIISESDEISQTWYQILLHNDIIYECFGAVLNKFASGDESNIKLNLLINQIISYFKIAEKLDYKFADNMSEYQIITTKLMDEYNLLAQILEAQIIQNNEQYNQFDKLLSRLEELNSKGKNQITIEDLINYLKMTFIITQQIQKSRINSMKHNFKLVNIRSILISANLLDDNCLSQIKEQVPQNDFFQLMFNHYSAIQSLSSIYEQISKNQDIFINKINFDNDAQFLTGIKLETYQLNHRIMELIENQKIIQNQLQEYSNSLITSDQKIHFANLLQNTYMFILKQYNILTQIEDLFIENFLLICQDIDSSKFIELIKKRLEMYIDLKKSQKNQQNLILTDDIQLLELIIEAEQQKYQNISRDEIIKILQEQNERLNKKSQIFLQQSNNQSVFASYLIYLLNITIIVQDIDINNHQEKSNKLIQELALFINHIKLQRYQNKQIDEQKQILYNYIVQEFMEVFAVDLEKVQEILSQQLQFLQQQEKKLSIEEVKLLTPSYQQLSDKVLDNNKSLSIKQKAIQFLKDQFTSEEWRIKDYLYYNSLAFHQYLNEKNQKVVGQLLLIARFKETDYRIINTLKGKDQIQQMDGLINNLWEETQDQVNNELQLTLNELQALQLSLQSEERKDLRDELLFKHKNLEQQIEQQLKNVNQIGDVLGVTVYFLKDIKRDLAVIQNKLDNIIHSIDQIGQDIKFLRGKTPQQILEIRMQGVLQNKFFQDAQSVYVQMRTQEFDFNTNSETKEQTPLFNIDNQSNGEIDEYLTQNQKTSLLIHGAAGSGKSLTARKIEEYLWIQYQKQCQNELWSDIRGTSPQIPIFIQLPTLKEPKFNAVEETLLSQLYRFDQKQIDLLKDNAQNSQIRIIFIMDSYDELPQQYQGINLIQTNKIYLWKPQNQVQISKVITTSRSEAFTTNDYRAWFWENDNIGIQSLKKLRLLPFDDLQRQDFLKQFSILQLKICIYDLLQVIGRNQDKTQILQDTFEIYTQFKQYLQVILKQENKMFLLDQNYSQKLIKIIKENKNVTLFNQEQETSFTKLILVIWHQNLYNDSITQMNLYSLLETPYMLNIVVEVLPLMNNQVSQPNGIKGHFIKSYINLTIGFLDNVIKTFESDPRKVNYKPDEVQLFKQYFSGQLLSKDSHILWETLIEHQFFNNWNVQSSYEHTVSQLEKIQSQLNRDLFPIKNSNEEQSIIVYKSLKSHKLTLFDFFNQFIEQFVESQRQKLIYSNDILDQNQFEQDIYRYATRLSILMFQRQETIIYRKPQGILFREQNQDPYQEFFEDSDKYGNYRKQIRKCIPLGQKGNFYQFRHKSIQEFLISKEAFNLFERAQQVFDLLNQLLSQLRKDNKQLDHLQLQLENNLNRQNKSQEEQRQGDLLIEILQSIQISFLNQINLQDTFNLGALKFIKNKISQDRDIYNVLHPLILLSSVSQQYIRFSSNCLILLHQIQPYQNEKDFSRIVISEISIDGAIFENCDLRYSKFDKVSIKGINLNFSNISNCIWTNLYSNDLPTIQLEGSNCYSQLSPNSQLILSYSKYNEMQNNIIIWDTFSGQQLIQLKGNTAILKASFSHNGLLLVSYDTNNTIRLWNVQTFTKVQEHKLKNNINFLGILFSEEDDKIAYYDYRQIYIINDLDKLSEVVTIQLKEICYAIYFSQQILLTSTSISNQRKNPPISINQQQQWNYNSGVMISQQIENLPQGVDPLFGCYHKDLLFIAYDNNTIGKWDRNLFQQIGSPFQGHVTFIRCMNVSQDGKYLVSGYDDSLIIIYDIKSCNKIQTLIGHKTEVKSVQFSHDVKFLITCSDDGQIRFWDAKVNKQQENSTFIQKLSFTSDSNQLIYLNSKGQIIFNETDTGQQMNQKMTEDINQISVMCLHPNSKYLLYTTGFLTKIFDLRLIKQVGITKQTEEKVLNLGYSFDGSKIFLADSYSIIIYDSTNWNELQNYNYPCSWSQLSSNYEYIMHFKRYQHQTSYKNYDAICLIDFDTQIHFSLNNDKEISKGFDLGYNNKMLVGIQAENSRNTILIWDLGLKETKPKKVQIKLENTIEAIKISPNCNTIFVGTQNGNIYAINPQKEYLLSLIASFQRPVKEIILSPNSKYLTAITEDPILYVSQIKEQDSQINAYIKYGIPQKSSFQTLIKDLIYENSDIKSHLGYDLKTIFSKKIENQDNLKQVVQ